MATASFGLVAIDCPDPRRLAEFYGAILGWEAYAPFGGNDWVQLRAPEGATIAFQKVDDFTPPDWPSGDPPQQLHLDLDVEDLDIGEAEVLALGARKHEVQPNPANFRVYLDPSGHPFCLVRIGSVP